MCFPCGQRAGKLSPNEDNHKFFGPFLRLIGCVSPPIESEWTLWLLWQMCYGQKWWCCASFGVQAFKRLIFHFLYPLTLTFGVEFPCKMSSWRDHLERSWDWAQLRGRQAQLKPPFQQSLLWPGIGVTPFWSSESAHQLNTTEGPQSTP